jgi:hypothetical protein
LRTLLEAIKNCSYHLESQFSTFKINKLRDLSPRTNYTDRETTDCRQSKCKFLWIERCRVVSPEDPYGRILRFLDRSRYFFFQVAPQLYSRGWVDPVPDPLFLRKSGSARNRTRTSGSLARNSEHKTTDSIANFQNIQLKLYSYTTFYKVDPHVVYCISDSRILVRYWQTAEGWQ